MGLKLIKNERTIFCDIDDTLVMHDVVKHMVGKLIYVKDTTGNQDIQVRTNDPMIQIVKEEISRGSQIVFWSRGGYQWAFNVLVALGFENYQQELLVMTKPFAYFDDSPVDKWMNDRVYLKPDTVYKHKRRSK